MISVTISFLPIDNLIWLLYPCYSWQFLCLWPYHTDNDSSVVFHVFIFEMGSPWSSGRSGNSCVLCLRLVLNMWSSWFCFQGGEITGQACPYCACLSPLLCFVFENGYMLLCLWNQNIISSEWPFHDNAGRLVKCVCSLLSEGLTHKTKSVVARGQVCLLLPIFSAGWAYLENLVSPLH